MACMLPLSTPHQDADLAAQAFMALPPGQDFTTAWQRTLASVRLGAPAPFFHELPALLAMARREGRGLEPVVALIAELFQLGFAAEALAAQHCVQGTQADPLSAFRLLRYGLACQSMAQTKPLAQALIAAVPPPARRPPIPLPDADGRRGLILLRPGHGGDMALLDQYLNRERWRVAHFVTDATPLPDLSDRRADDHWYGIADLDIVAIAGLIDRERPTILLDGAGYRPAQLALHRGPVPVQVLLAGPVSSLVPAYDWRLCDAGLLNADGTPPADDIMTERPLLLPRPLLPLVPPAGAPKPHPRNAEMPPTFGALAKPAKLSLATLALWGALLRAQSDARLRLHHPLYSHPAARRRVLEGLQRHGIGAERVIFSDNAAPWDALHNMDVLLDPVPYGGRSSVALALWMGKPVVTWPGDSMLAGRRATAWLTALGLRQWVASDAPNYLQIARTVLNDRPALGRWRLGLRPLVQQSPLIDGAGWAGAVESALHGLISP